MLGYIHFTIFDSFILSSSRTSYSLPLLILILYGCTRSSTYVIVWTWLYTYAWVLTPLRPTKMATAYITTLLEGELSISCQDFWKCKLKYFSSKRTKLSINQKQKCLKSFWVLHHEILIWKSNIHEKQCIKLHSWIFLDWYKSSNWTLESF